MCCWLAQTVRPLLSASLLLLSLRQIPRAGEAIENLWGAGECVVAGGMVMSVAVAVGAIGLGLALQPLHSAAVAALATRQTTLARRTCSGALSALGALSRRALQLLPLVLVPAVLWSMWETLGPARSCWHDVGMRELAVADAIGAAVALALVGAYTLLRAPPAAPLLLSTAVSSIGSAPLRGHANPDRGLVAQLLCLRGVLRRHGRLLCCLLGALFIGAFMHNLHTYHSCKSQSARLSSIIFVFFFLCFFFSRNRRRVADTYLPVQMSLVLFPVPSVQRYRTCSIGP